jgi:hypothetical protein
MNLGRGILGELDGMATLTFCGGDPVNMIDPDGLRPKLTTWLRSGGTYWDVNDMPDNVRASIYATDYDKDGVVSTRAATHALIGVLGVFEGAALMGWDVGEGLSGSENIGEENMIAGMFNLAMDEGVGTLAKEMVLSPVKAIASGDAEQFGTGMFGLYIVGRQSLAQGNGYLNARNSGMGRWDSLKTGLRTQPEGLRFKNGTKTVAPASEPIVESTQVPSANSMRGRLGTKLTRDHIADVASELESRGWEITGGGGKLPEEYLPGLGGGRKGSSFPDITATKNGKTLRVNTVVTYADGITPTSREAVNATRIRLQTGEHLLIVPKPKPIRLIRKK